MRALLVDPELEAIGIDSTVVDGVTIVRVPSQFSMGCLVAALGSTLVAGFVAGAIAWLLGASSATMGWIAAAVSAVSFLVVMWIVLKFVPLAFKIRVDDGKRMVSIGRNGLWRASEFGFDEVESVGVGWCRGHGERADKGAPIWHLGIRLTRPQRGASVDLLGLERGQRKPFVIWLHKRVAPNSELSQLDAD